MSHFLAGGKQLTDLVLIYAQHCQRLYYKQANICIQAIKTFQTSPTLNLIILSFQSSINN